LQRAVLAVSGIVFVSWFLIALAHIDDSYGVDHVSGAWIALARYVNEGTLYPPLFNGHVFGGTRYMPLEFVTHAGLARVTGEYLVSGKLLAYASDVGMYVLLFVITRRISGSKVLAIGLVAAVLSTNTGLFGSTAIGGDTLPVALQLGAIYAVTRRSPAGSAWASLLAGLLCALAFFTKLTAVWAALALVAWLAVRDRRRLAAFAISLVGSGAVLFAAFELASDGRMSHNLVALASAGAQLSGRDTLTKFAAIGQDSASAVWILVPFAIVAVGTGIARRRLTVYQVSLVLAAAILLPVLRDVGADANHLIDVEVLTAIVFAEAVRLAEPRATAFVWPLALTAILWGTVTSYQVNFRHETEVAIHSLLGRDTGYTAGPVLEGVITRRDRILSEDPYVAVSRNEDPVVLDAFMLIRIAHDHPAWQSELIRRIKDHRFMKIVLEHTLDPKTRWYRVYSLGGPVVTAIAHRYRLANVVDNVREGGDYFVYVPK
jgi:hypothetical protein